MDFYTTSSITGFRFYLGLTGKVNGDFTKTLYRNQSTVAAETVTVTEDANGWYYARFTPTVSQTQYELGVQLDQFVVKETFRDRDLTTVERQAIAAEVLDAICEIEGSYTLQQILSILLAGMAGRVAISGLTATFKTPNNNANRIVGTVDANDQRTAITLTPSS